MRNIFLLMALGITATVSAQDQVIDRLVYEIRHPQTDSTHFRKAVESIGEYLALKVAEELPVKEVSVQTLTDGEATHRLLEEQPVVVTILRGGIPLCTGVQRVFPDAPVGFFAMSRDEETLKAAMDYVALPQIEGRYVIFVDTLLATGGSLLDAIQVVERYHPKKIFVLSAIAA